MSRSVADFLVLRRKNERLTEKNGRLTEENERLKAQVKECTRDLAEMHGQYNELGFQSHTTIGLLSVTIAQQKDQLFEREEEIDGLRSHSQSYEQLLSSLLEENERLKAQVKECTRHLVALSKQSLTDALKQLNQEFVSRSSLKIEALNATIAQLKQELLKTKQQLDALKVHSRIVDASNKQLTCSLFQRVAEKTALLKRIKELQPEISSQELRMTT